MTTIRVGHEDDEWPASSPNGWRVVVEVDAANEVTVSVAGLDRDVAVGLLREAADTLEGAPDEATATYEEIGAQHDVVDGHWVPKATKRAVPAWQGRYQRRLLDTQAERAAIGERIVYHLDHGLTWTEAAAAEGLANRDAARVCAGVYRAVVAGRGRMPNGPS